MHRAGTEGGAHVRQRTGSTLAVPVLAWGLCGLFGLLGAASVVLFTLGGADALDLIAVLVVGYALVGALVAVREPWNAVGWLMLAIAIAFALQSLVEAYVLDPDRLGVVAVGWVGRWVWYFWIYLAAIMLPLVFPDGRLLSPRWRGVLWLGVISLVCSLPAEALAAGPLDVESPEPIPNPLGVTGPAASALTVLGVVGDALLAASVILSIASLARRLRGSTGRQRQQLKWFGYVGVLALGGLLLAMVEVFWTAVGNPGAPTWPLVVGAVGWMSALILLIAGIPIAVGVAILRHRLYDIDLVIRRTLVYGSLTLTLAGVYLISVLSLRAVLAPDDRAVRPGRRRVHPCRGRTVPPCARAHPARRRPSLLPQQVRRRPHRRDLLRSAAPGGRPRSGPDGSGVGGARNRAARARVAVAQENGTALVSEGPHVVTRRLSSPVAAGVVLVGPDVDPPAREPRGEPGVLALLADGERELEVGDDHPRRPLLRRDHLDGGDLRR